MQAAHARLMWCMEKPQIELTGKHLDVPRLPKDLDKQSPNSSHFKFQFQVQVL